MDAHSETCEQLDQILVEYMDVMEQLQKLRGSYTATVCEGYFNMAKARYLMGVNAISKLQYDTVMTPLVHVLTRSVDEDSEVEFSVERTPAGRTKTSSEQTSTSSQVRQRRGADGSRGIEDVPKDDSVRMVEENTVKDPLRWFGVLLPPCLPLAQQQFIQAIEQAVQTVEAQGRLEALRKKYCSLLRQKAQLVTPE